MMLQLKRGATEASFCVFMCVRVCTSDGKIGATTQRRDDTAKHRETFHKTTAFHRFLKWTAVLSSERAGTRQQSRHTGRGEKGVETTERETTQEKT